MTYDVKYVRRPDYIHAIVTGQNSRENFLHYTDDVLAECRRAQCRRTLIEDKLTGPRMSDGEIFIVATEASRRALGFYEALAFVDELRALRDRPGVTRDSPSMRSVGYRQFWSYLENEDTLEEARDKALFATRQLAKRQLTWLRSESSIISVNPLEDGVLDTISKHLAQRLG